MQKLVVENLCDTPVRAEYYLDCTPSGHLGQGGYGTVVKATHKVSAEVRACKILNLKQATPGAVGRIFNEIAVMKEVNNHPHIVRLLEVFYERHYIYLIMELVEGGDMFTALNAQDGHHFSEALAADVMTQLLSAIRYFHNLNIVHRDIKVENILFDHKVVQGTEAGNRVSPQIKLTDFGLAKHFQGGEVLHARVCVRVCVVWVLVPLTGANVSHM